MTNFQDFALHIENYQRINRLIFYLNKCAITLDLCFSGLDGAGTCLGNEKVRTTQMYLCNANKIKQPFLTIDVCAMHLHYLLD